MEVKFNSTDVCSLKIHFLLSLFLLSFLLSSLAFLWLQLFAEVTRVFIYLLEHSMPFHGNAKEFPK